MFFEFWNILNTHWFSTIVIFLIIFYFVNYVKKIYSYPRGPFPLPFIGNVLHFRGEYNEPSRIYQMTEWGKKYGPIYTLWVGDTPLIVVNSYELNREASIVRKNDFIERSDTTMYKIFRSGTHNISFSSGPYWESLRMVGVFAIRKFAVSERLSEIINEVMDESIELMLKEKQSMNPRIFIDFMIYNIFALTAFGKKFGSIDEKSFIEAKRLNEEFHEVVGNGLITEFIPWLRPFYYSKEVMLKDMIGSNVDMNKSSFMEHKKTFTPGIIRDFCDCVIEAKEEAIRENYNRNKYLSDNNLYMVVTDLFRAGTETSQNTMRWAILLLGNYPEVQEKLYKEIVDNIGDRSPTHSDRNHLHFTYAFLLEVLRFRVPAALGIDHTTGVDTQLGGHKIPKNTRVVFNLWAQNLDPDYWTEPENFDPNRFLDSNGEVIKGRLPSFATFGWGRRNCPGQKFALNDLFIIITRLVQNIRIELTTGADSADLVPINCLVDNFPKDYKINCYPRINRYFKSG